MIPGSADPIGLLSDDTVLVGKVSRWYRAPHGMGQAAQVSKSPWSPSHSHWESA